MWHFSKRVLERTYRIGLVLSDMGEGSRDWDFDLNTVGVIL